MGFHYEFRSLEDEKDAKNMISWMRLRPLDYRNFNGWVDRVEHEIFSGYKQAILGFCVENRQPQLVSYLLFQQHKQLPFMEFKSLRVDERVQDRYFASFSLKQGEKEAKRRKLQGIICDVRESRENVIGLLLHNGFSPIATTSLYEPTKKDVIMIKDFQKSRDILRKVA